MTMKPQIMRPRLLAQFPELCCGVSTRIGGVSPEPLGMNLSFHAGDRDENVEQNRRLFFGEMNIPPENVAFTRQVHGDNVHEARSAGTYEACDALVTNGPGVFLTVSVADCLPVLLFDRVTKSVGAVHAGWRGSRSAIVARSVEMMRRRFHASPETMLAYIGPAAGVCCYEVGEEVAAAFGSTYVQRTKGRKPHLDLKLVNRTLLIEAGLLAANIEVSDACTICQAGLFHSFRRDGQRSGRMLGVIGIRGIATG